MRPYHFAPLALSAGLLLSSCTSGSDTPVTPGTSSTGPVTSSSSQVVQPAGKLIRLGYLMSVAPTDLARIKWTNFTHIGTFTITPWDDGSLYRVANAGNAKMPIQFDEPGYRTILPGLKANGIKTLIVVGGWGKPSEPFAAICQNDAYIQNFIIQAKELVMGTRVQPDGSIVMDEQADGIDIDWEYPATAAEGACFDKIVLGLKAALPATKTVSAAIMPTKGYYGIAALNQLDWVGLMSYDYGVSTNNKDHSAFGLTASSVGSLANRGLRTDKLLIGLALYGINLTTKEQDPWKYYAANIAPGQAWLPVTDPNYKIFTPPDSIQAKLNLAVNVNARGVMYWEITQDYYEGVSITTLVDNSLKAMGK